MLLLNTGGYSSLFVCDVSYFILEMHHIQLHYDVAIYNVG